MVLSEPIRTTDPLYSSVDGLVLTEWKVFRQEDDINQKIAEAQKQAALYAKGSLYALELSTYRYLVMVSGRNVVIPQGRQEFTENNVTYRVINIAYNPDRPSTEARETKR